MKKFLLTMFACSVSMCILPLVFAVSVESLISSIDQASAKKGSPTHQISFLKSLETLLNSPSFTTSQYKDIFAELSSYTTEKIKQLSTP
ncbi:MAG: hypothetical protein LBP53_03600 [Candidatus Peribacteria bacterium]|nr:hypothetical protein [Candidatus Peribacteria bacterium]